MMRSPLPLAALLIAQFLWSAIAAGHGTHEERVELYTAKLAREPGDVNARHELALAYVENEEWEHALEQLDLASAMLKPDSGLDFSVTRARALAIGGKTEEAREVLDRFLVKNPADAPARLERARIFAALSLPSESLTDYRLAMANFTKPDADIYLEVATALGRQGENEEAISLVEKGISAQGNEPSLIQMALELETAAGKYDAALSRLAILEKQAPRPEPWMARRAELLAKAGRAEESRAAWTALKQHLSSLPNLERGTPDFLALSAKADAALAAH